MLFINFDKIVEISAATSSFLALIRLPFVKVDTGFSVSSDILN